MTICTPSDPNSRREQDPILRFPPFPPETPFRKILIAKFYGKFHRFVTLFFAKLHLIAQNLFLRQWVNGLSQIEVPKTTDFMNFWEKLKKKTLEILAEFRPKCAPKIPPKIWPIQKNLRKLFGTGVKIPATKFNGGFPW